MHLDEAAWFRAPADAAGSRGGPADARRRAAGSAGRDGSPVVGGRGSRCPTAPEQARVAAADAAERDAWVVLAAVRGLGPVGVRPAARGDTAPAAACSCARPASRAASARLVRGGRRTPTAGDGARGPTPAAGDRDGRRGDAGAIARAASASRPRCRDPRRTTRYPARLARDRRCRRPSCSSGAIPRVDGPAARGRDRRDAAPDGDRAGRPRRGSRTRSPASARRVVSGLAVGIDGAAHAAAIGAGGPTVAVIGCGHERLYPAAHRGLAGAIVDGGGAVVSEFAPETAPIAGHVPAPQPDHQRPGRRDGRRRGRRRSGALITASWALEQGRDCFLVPGRLDDPSVGGLPRLPARVRPDGAGSWRASRSCIEDLGLVGRRHASRRAGIAAGASRSRLDGGRAGVAAARRTGDRPGGRRRPDDRRRARRGDGSGRGDGARGPHVARAPRPRGRDVRTVPRGRRARRPLPGAARPRVPRVGRLERASARDPDRAA